MVEEAWLTGWVKPGEIGQSKLWIWILQAVEDYVRIQYYEKINTVASILCGKVLIFLRFGSFLFCKCIPLPSLSDIYILRDSVSDLKISNWSVIIGWGEKMLCLRISIGSRWRSGNWLVRQRDWFCLTHFWGKVLAGKFLAENVLMQEYDVTCERTEKTFSFSRYWPT